MNPTDPVAALCRHHHKTDPEQLIVRLCRELLAECPTEAGPTSLRILGSCQGVRSYHSRPIHPEAGCSGLLIPSDGGYEITVNPANPWNDRTSPSPTRSCTPSSATPAPAPRPRRRKKNYATSARPS